jgi:hypothetical protein
MAAEDVVRPDRGAHIDSREKLTVEEELPVIEVSDDPATPPRIQIGAGRRDVYRSRAVARCSG